MTAIVIDAAVSASWLLGDEDDPRAGRALTALEERAGIVPQLWHFEMRNILLVAHRRDRITRDGMAERVFALADLSLETDGEPDLDRVLALADVHRLSFYAALYLDLAVRRGAELASLDLRLLEAATSAHLGVLPVKATIRERRQRHLKGRHSPGLQPFTDWAIL